MLFVGTILLFSVNPASGQEVNFGEHIPDDEKYAIYLSQLGGYETLDFGMLFSGQHFTIDRNSEDVAILEIEAVRYLDVFISIHSENFLFLDGEWTSEVNKRIPFILEAAYANSGKGNFGPGHRQSFSGMNARIPMFRRSSGPPGPPPVPPHSGYVPPRESAYVILSGEVTVPSVIQAGYYETQVIIEITYDL